MAATKSATERLSANEPSLLTRSRTRKGSHGGNEETNSSSVHGDTNRDRVYSIFVAISNVFSIRNIDENYYGAIENSIPKEEIASAIKPPTNPTAAEVAQAKATASAKAHKLYINRLYTTTLGKWNPFGWLEVAAYALLTSASRISRKRPIARRVALGFAQLFNIAAKTLNAGMSFLFGVPAGIAGSFFSIFTAWFVSSRDEKPYKQVYKNHFYSSWAPFVGLKKYFHRLELVAEKIQKNPVPTVLGVVIMGGLLAASVLVPGMFDIHWAQNWFGQFVDFLFRIIEPTLTLKDGANMGEAGAEQTATILSELIVASFIIPAGISLAQETANTADTMFPAESEKTANNQHNPKDKNNESNDTTPNDSPKHSPKFNNNGITIKNSDDGHEYTAIDPSRISSIITAGSKNNSSNISTTSSPLLHSDDAKLPVSTRTNITGNNNANDQNNSIKND